MTPQLGAFIAFGIFMIGVIFHAGRMTARVDQLERNDAATAKAIEGMRADLSSILRLLSHENPEG